MVVKFERRALACYSALILAAHLSAPAQAQEAPPPSSWLTGPARVIQGNENPETGDAITNLRVNQDANGRWVATCEVTLGPKRSWRLLMIEAALEPKGGTRNQSTFTTAPLQAKAGPQTSTFELPRPEIYTDVYKPERGYIERQYSPVQTEWVVATLRGTGTNGQTFEISKAVKQTIRWPDKSIWDADQAIRREGAAASLAKAVQLIDEGTQDSLGRARVLLERLLLSDGKLTPAYIEMARVAMKANWGPEGLAQARRYLDSALNIAPASVNALILRGYVSAHQGRYKEAEADFQIAARSNPRNLWLWANWGELLVMQGKKDQAINMYRKAVDHPPTHDTYDRARADAYGKLITLYEGKHEVNALEEMHRNRVRDFGDVGCYLVTYAMFEIQEKNDPDVAIDLLKDTSQIDCQEEGSKEAIGMAYYLKWSRASTPQRMNDLNRARVYFPVSARLFYAMASHANTMAAATALVKSGESVDQKDNSGMTALAYALERRDHDTARGLVKIGASPAAKIGEQAVPVALIPVFNDDIEGIRLMKKLGVKYSTISFQGMTAMSYARRMGNKRMLDVLGSQSPDI